MSKCVIRWFVNKNESKVILAESGPLHEIVKAHFEVAFLAVVQTPSRWQPL